MNIAVTGGAGYIGSTLIKDLLNERDSIFSIDNEMIGSYDHLRERVQEDKELIVGDIRNLNLLTTAWENCDCIAHLAALPGLTLCNENPEEAVSVNIYGTHQVLEAARKLDIDRVVFCSSASVYGKPEKLPVTESQPLRPLNLYGVTKLAGEKIMDTYYYNHGIDTVNLRFGNIYGVGLYTRWDTVIPKFVKQALSNEELTIYGDGGASRDFVHVEDIANALNLSLKTPGIGGETFNVGGETLTISQIAETVIEEAQNALNIESSYIHTKSRVGETREFSYDLTKIKERLGFSNRWTVREGVKQLINYWTLQHHNNHF